MCAPSSTLEEAGHVAPSWGLAGPRRASRAADCKPARERGGGGGHPSPLTAGKAAARAKSPTKCVFSTFNVRTTANDFSTKQIKYRFGGAAEKGHAGCGGGGATLRAVEMLVCCCCSQRAEEAYENSWSSAERGRGEGVVERPLSATTLAPRPLLPRCRREGIFLSEPIVEDFLQR